jgi:small subunit ribosomal protein S4
MIRKSKKYFRPRKPFEGQRIKEENILVKKYGLKNKIEIWRALAKVNYFRSRAKTLASMPLEEQEVLFSKLRNIGLNVHNTAEVLDLKVEDLLERRLATVVAKKKIANTPKQARQMIVHKRILVDGRVINAPSYKVPVELEDKIELRIKKKAHKPKAIVESVENAEAAEESSEENAEETE